MLTGSLALIVNGGDIVYVLIPIHIVCVAVPGVDDTYRRSVNMKCHSTDETF